MKPKQNAKRLEALRLLVSRRSVGKSDEDARGPQSETRQAQSPTLEAE